MNLHLYILEASARPLGVGKAMVYGSLRCYLLQNTHKQNYLKQIKLLFVRMKAHVWRPELLKELMVKETTSLEQPKPTSKLPEKESNNNNDRLFIHLKYHPRGISRQQIRTIFEEICDNINDTAAKVEKVTVALSRPKNLKGELVNAKLYQPVGQEMSTLCPDN